MTGPKTGVNTQWGLVSADGTRPVPLAVGDGGEPLIDPNGVVYVQIAGGPLVPLHVIVDDLLAIAGVTPLMSVAGRLGVNLAAGDVNLALAAGAPGRLLAVLQDAAGNAPLYDVSGRIGAVISAGANALGINAAGRIGTNLFSGDVALALAGGAAGRLLTVLQDAAGNAPTYDALGSARARIAGVGGNIMDVDSGGAALIRDASPTAVPPAGHASLVSRSFSGGTAVTGHSVIGAAGKKLLRAFGLATTSAQIAMLFDSAAVPANGTSPACPSQLINVGSPNNNFMFDFTRTGGLPITNGVAVAMSTSPGTLTLVGAGSMFVTVEYAD